MNLTPVLKSKFLNAGGTACLPGGKLYTYIAGTTTPQATYTDQGGLTPNANPVILDANGEASVWLDPALSYKFKLTDSSDVVQWTVDAVSGVIASGLPVWNANTTYSQGTVVADSSGYGLLYQSLVASNVNNQLTDVSKWALYPGGRQRATALSADTTLALSDHGCLVRSNSTAAARTHTLPPCSTTPIGYTVKVKDVGSGGFTTSVKGSGTDQIDGAVTWTTTLSQYDSATFRNNGVGYDVI